MAHRKAAVGGRAGSDNETLADYLDRSWVPSKAGRVQQGTLDQYGWAVRNHIVPLLGAVRLRDLTAEVVDSFVAELVTPGPSGKSRLGSTSAQVVRKVLSMALQEAVDRGRLPRSPATLTQPPWRDRTHRKLAWTLDEARQFLARVADHVGTPPSTCRSSRVCGVASCSACDGTTSTSTRASSS